MYATRDPAASYEPAEQQLSKYRDGNQVRKNLYRTRITVFSLP